ncbi:MAG: glucose 1-dehydrogenase [Acidimicrobiia bacterium]|nr:glucose 1-dehydrogenase [Acidimicrobiia bacterium]
MNTPPFDEEHSILDRFRLDGRVALITGGAQGLGYGFARALADVGACIMIADVNEEGAASAAEALTASGFQASSIQADVTNADEIDAMISATIERFGDMHIAINNAGINFNSAAEDTPMTEWDTTFDLNLRGLFMCCQAEGRYMISKGYGKIINIASMSSLIVPHPQKQAAYNTSKAGVAHLTASLATEWAEHGIRVNAVSPGCVRTPLLESEALRDLKDVWIEQTPMGRLAEVSDIQAGVVYLASDASDYMIGHNLAIMGGQNLW